MKRKIYVSGPMSFDPVTLNRAAFEDARQHLTSLGYRVVVPHDLTEGLDLHPTEDYDHILKIDVKAMLDCDEVVTLQGWEYSPGAGKEVQIARIMNIPVLPIAHYQISRYERTAR